jgi:hypothetical protein
MIQQAGMHGYPMALADHAPRYREGPRKFVVAPVVRIGVRCAAQDAQHAYLKVVAELDYELIVNTKRLFGSSIDSILKYSGWQGEMAILKEEAFR